MSHKHSLPGPRPLWKWAAQNTARHDGHPIRFQDWLSRCWNQTPPRPDERGHGGSVTEAYQRRALVAGVQATLTTLKTKNVVVPAWVAPLLEPEIDLVAEREARLSA